MSDDNNQPDEAEVASQPGILIRVAEWFDWLPAEVYPINKEEQAPVAHGYTGIAANQDERLIDLTIESTGLGRSAQVVDEETGEELGEKHWRLFAFRASLARNVDNMGTIQSIRKTQVPPQPPKERDRRADLAIVGEDPRKMKKRPKR